MRDLIGATRVLAENAGSVPVFLDPPQPDGGSRARLIQDHYLVDVVVSSLTEQAAKP